MMPVVSPHEHPLVAVVDAPAFQGGDAGRRGPAVGITDGGGAAVEDGGAPGRRVSASVSRHLVPGETRADVGRLELGTLDGIIGCVAAGPGVAMLPRPAMMRAMRDQPVRLHVLPPAYARVETTIVGRRHSLQRRALKAFLERCRWAIRCGWRSSACLDWWRSHLTPPSPPLQNGEGGALVHCLARWVRRTGDLGVGAVRTGVLKPLGVRWRSASNGTQTRLSPAHVSSRYAGVSSSWGHAGATERSTVCSRQNRTPQRRNRPCGVTGEQRNGPRLPLSTLERGLGGEVRTPPIQTCARPSPAPNLWSFCGCNGSTDLWPTFDHLRSDEPRQKLAVYSQTSPNTTVSGVVG
ncbi:MAG: hypothetical protein H7338_24185 [Candidatus Sericytochromatia bacterium]|nr:hypothetical protein [Candidatus Sericytochromatia bacterium]